MWLKAAVESLFWAFAHQLFFAVLGEASGVQFNALAFTPFGFIVFYIASYVTLKGLRD